MEALSVGIRKAWTSRKSYQRKLANKETEKQLERQHCCDAKDKLSLTMSETFLSTIVCLILIINILKSASVVLYTLCFSNIAQTLNILGSSKTSRITLVS